MLRANRPIIAFFDAIKSLRIRQLALILKAGYDPNLMMNSRGQNGLQFMVNYFGATEAHFRLQVPLNKSTYLSMAKLLLDSGLDSNAMDLLTDETVIFDAIRFNDKEMVALLLNYTDLSLRNKNGETALMCAARFGSKQVTRMLLDHLRHLEMDGYFLRQRNRFGLTALELARAENLEAAKVLAKHLIAFGHHTGAVLARSASHHQLAGVDSGALAPRQTNPVVGRGMLGLGPGPGVRASAMDLYGGLEAADCYSLASDFSESELYNVGPSARVAGTPARRRPNVYRPYYDAKAAEFSAYLLDQQQELGGGGGSGQAGIGEQQQQNAMGWRMNSDEDDATGFGAGGGGASRPANGAGEAGSAPAPGQLMRSRSCMISQSGQQQHQAAKQAASGGQKRRL